MVQFSRNWMLARPGMMVIVSFHLDLTTIKIVSFIDIVSSFLHHTHMGKEGGWDSRRTWDAISSGPFFLSGARTDRIWCLNGNTDGFRGHCRCRALWKGAFCCFAAVKDTTMRNNFKMVFRESWVPNLGNSLGKKISWYSRTSSGGKKLFLGIVFLLSFRTIFSLVFSVFSGPAILSVSHALEALKFETICRVLLGLAKKYAFMRKVKVLLNKVRGAVSQWENGFYDRLSFHYLAPCTVKNGEFHSVHAFNFCVM